MAWISPITDRSLTDIANRTSKAFFNVADWTRVNGNSAEIAGQLSALLGASVTLHTLTAPTVTVFPTAAAINQLIENIERLRVAACLPASLLTALPYSYQAGNGAAAPDYAAVNAWEQNQLLLHQLVPNAADYQIRCGVAAAGQRRDWQNRYR